MENESSAILSAISALGQNVAAIKQDIAGLETSVNEVRKEVGALRSELLTVRTDIMARIDRMQNKISEVTDDITVNYASTDQSGRTARAAQEELRGLYDIIFAMQRQIRRIAAQVFGPDEAA